MQARTVKISSVFPASVDEVWEKIQRLETLQYIAAPYATFEPLDKSVLTWEEGVTTDYSFKMFGLFPFGKHSIKVVKFNKTKGLIYTNEKNKSVPVWNHTILLQRIEANATCYTDEVEIDAGWKTFFVYCWSILFYKHRQRKWLKLLGSK